MARHSSLESLERSKCDLIGPPKPRKKEVELSDHIQFLITEKSPPQACSVDVTAREAIDEGDVLSEGTFYFLFMQQIFRFQIMANELNLRRQAKLLLSTLRYFKFWKFCKQNFTLKMVLFWLMTAIEMGIM